MVNGDRRVRYALWLSCALVVPVSGCTLGPSALRVSRVRYNEAIQNTTDEQLLLNLVRLEYRDTPLFVEVGSVQAQFVFERSASVGGTLNENVGVDPLNPDVLNISGKAGYTERPTVTFSPLQGDEFVTRMLTPVRLDTILLLCRSGWSIERVLRLTVQRMNNLDNASRASGPTPDQAPVYEQFVEVCRLLRALQLHGALEVGYESRHKELSDPMPLEAIEAADLVAAAGGGYSFRRTDDGGYVLAGTTDSPVLQIAPVARDTSEVQRLAELLRLDPTVSRFDLGVGVTGQLCDLAGPNDRRAITLWPRSLMGILFFLSQGIEVPEAHREAGIVTTTRDLAGNPFDWSQVTGDLLRVRCQRARPAGAAVAVLYRGRWFFIDDADLKSKSTFSLLAQLFALQAGEAETATPVLTLGVGG